MTYVQLLAPTRGALPLETLYCMWLASRTELKVPTPDQVRNAYTHDVTSDFYPHLFVDPARGAEGFRSYYDEQINMMLSMDVPLLEGLTFVFVVHDMSISLREQLVRHREGAYWIQSGRIRDQSSFATSDRYRVPVSIANNPAALERWESMHAGIQHGFNALLAAGIPIEDARDVLPASQLHRGSVVMNYRALKKMVGKRTSFIAQAGLWTPLLMSLSTQLRALDERLARLFEPPAIRNGKYIGDPHELENVRRLNGDDPLPPDPIFMKYEARKHTGAHPVGEWLRMSRGPNAVEEYVSYAANVVKLWGPELMRAHGYLGDRIAQEYTGAVDGESQP